MLIDYLLVERISILVPAALRGRISADDQDGADFRRIAAGEDVPSERLLRGLSLAGLSWYALVVVSLFSTIALLLIRKAIVNLGMVHTMWFLMPLAAMSVLTLAALEYIVISLRATSARDNISARGGGKRGAVNSRRRCYPKWYDFWISAGAAAALFVGVALGVVFR